MDEWSILLLSGSAVSSRWFGSRGPFRRNFGKWGLSGNSMPYGGKFGMKTKNNPKAIMQNTVLFNAPSIKFSILLECQRTNRMSTVSLAGKMVGSIICSLLKHKMFSFLDLFQNVKSERSKLNSKLEKNLVFVFAFGGNLAPWRLKTSLALSFLEIFSVFFLRNAMLRKRAFNSFLMNFTIKIRFYS